MTYSLSVRSFLSVRHLRWLLLGGVLITCVSLAVVTARVRREDPLLSRTGGTLFSIQGFRTFLYDEGPQLSVSGGSLTVSHMKFLGPFRLGVAHSLTARDVIVETFHDLDPRSQSRAHPPSLNRFLASLTPSFNRLLASLMPQQAGIAIAHAECGPLQVIQHEGDRALTIFTAAICRTSLRSTTVVCKDGMIHARGHDVPFRELSSDGRSWSLRTTRGKRQVVDELADLYPGWPPG